MSACSSGPSCNASSTSCRDARDGTLLPPRGVELPVDGVVVQHEDGGPLCRDWGVYDVSLLSCDGEPRAHDVQRLSYDVLLLALTFCPPSNLYSRSGNPQAGEPRKMRLVKLNATTIPL